MERCRHGLISAWCSDCGPSQQIKGTNMTDTLRILCKRCNERPAMVRKDTGAVVNGFCGLCQVKNIQEARASKKQTLEDDKQEPEPEPCSNCGERKAKEGEHGLCGYCAGANKRASILDVPKNKAPDLKEVPDKLPLKQDHLKFPPDIMKNHLIKDLLDEHKDIEADLNRMAVENIRQPWQEAVFAIKRYLSHKSYQFFATNLERKS